MHTIYLIRNTENGMVYIGQTSFCLSLRWFGHRAAAWCNPRSPLQIAMAASWYSFTIERLELCEPEQANEREYLAMDRFESRWPEGGYNVMPAPGYFWIIRARLPYVPMIGPLLEWPRSHRITSAFIGPLFCQKCSKHQPGGRYGMCKAHAPHEPWRPPLF